MPELIADLNRHLRGWANYFALGYPTPIFRQMDWYVLPRLCYNMRSSGIAGRSTLLK